MHRKYGFGVAPRPWYEWLLWLVWLLMEIFLLQNAIMSGYPEFQTRAAIIFWVMFSVFLIAGVIVWFVHRPRREGA